MTLQEYSEENEIVFEDAWPRFREMSANGISSYTDAEIRNLFAEMSMAQSYQTVRCSIIQQELDLQKFRIEVVVARLLNGLYTTGPMTTRNAKVQGDAEFISANEKKTDILQKLVIVKAELDAIAIATAALSREMSMRLKQ